MFKWNGHSVTSLAISLINCWCCSIVRNAMLVLVVPDIYIFSHQPVEVNCRSCRYFHYNVLGLSRRTSENREPHLSFSLACAHIFHARPCSCIKSFRGQAIMGWRRLTENVSSTVFTESHRICIRYFKKSFYCFHSFPGGSLFSWQSDLLTVFKKFHFAEQMINIKSWSLAQHRYQTGSNICRLSLFFKE